MIGLKRFLALALSAAMSLSLCAPAMASGGGGATEEGGGGPQYICGLEEHVHSDACYLRDPIGDLLSANGLSGYTGRVQVVHQHGEACYEDGVLVCPLADASYMAGYPNVDVLHKHDGGCSGRTMTETDYALSGGGAAGSGAGRSGTGASEDYYVVGVPGGDKDTGDTTGNGHGNDPAYVEEHVHGDGCADDCDKPVVLVLSGSGASSRVPICGKREHAHSEACLAAKLTVQAVKLPSIANAATFAVTTVSDRDTRIDLQWVNWNRSVQTLDAARHNATWRFTGSGQNSSYGNDYHMSGIMDMNLSITRSGSEDSVGDGTGEDWLSLSIPIVVHSMPLDSSTSSGTVLEYRLSENDIRDGFLSGGYADMFTVSVKDDVIHVGLTDEGRQYDGSYEHVITVPVYAYRAYRNSSGSLSSESCGFNRMYDAHTAIDYSISDEVSGTTHSIHSDVYKSMGTALLGHAKYGEYSKASLEDRSNPLGWLRYNTPRVFEWTEDVETAYGITESEWDSLTDPVKTDDGEAYYIFEFAWFGRVHTWVPVTVSGSFVDTSGKADVIGLALDRYGSISSRKHSPGDVNLSMASNSKNFRKGADLRSFEFDWGSQDSGWHAPLPQAEYTDMNLMYMTASASYYEDADYGGYDGAGFRFLVRYPVSAITGADGAWYEGGAVDTLQLKARLDIEARPLLDPSATPTTASDTISVIEPYANAFSIGDNYSMDMSQSVYSGCETALFRLEHGLNVDGFESVTITGTKSVSKNDELSDPSVDTGSYGGKGDGVADSKQVRIKYEVINGTVSFMETVSTKRDADGNPSSDGAATLLAAHIPAVTGSEGFGSCTWSPYEPTVGTKVSSDVTFTVTFHDGSGVSELSKSRQGSGADLGTSMSTGMLGAIVYDPSSNEWLSLGVGDYYISSVSGASYTAGRPYYNTVGVILGYTPIEDVSKNTLQLQALTWDSPDEWTVLLDSTYGSWTKDVPSVLSNISSKKAIALRMYDPKADEAIMLKMSGIRITFCHDGPIMSDLVAWCTEHKSTLQNRMVFFTAGSDNATGSSIVHNMDSGISDGIKPVIGKLSNDVLGSEGYSNTSFPLIKLSSGGSPLSSSGFSFSTVVSYLPRGEGGNPVTTKRSDGTYVGLESPSDEVASVDWVVGSMVRMMYGVSNSGIKAIDDLGDDFPLDANTAVYRIMIPKGVEVTGVKPGYPDDFYPGSNSYICGGNYNSNTSSYSFSYWDKDGLIDGLSQDGNFSYEITENYQGTGYTCLEIEAVAVPTLYDKKSTGYKSSVSNGSTYPTALFGGFTVSTAPIAGDTFDAFDGNANSMLRLNVATCFRFEDGRDYKFDYSGTPGGLYVDSGSGTTFSHVDSTDSAKFFADANANGDTSERSVAMYGTGFSPFSRNSNASGYQIHVRGPEDEFYHKSVNVGPGDAYQYRLTYSLLSDKSDGVVLFASLEDLATSEWQGVLEGIDMSKIDAQGVDYTVYVNESRIDSTAYFSEKATAAVLTTANGWYPLSDSTDFSKVKSVAIDFKDTVFAKSLSDHPSIVQAYLDMRAPMTGFTAATTAARNRSVFSDRLLRNTDNQPRTLMSNTVSAAADVLAGAVASKDIDVTGVNAPYHAAVEAATGDEPKTVRVTLDRASRNFPTYDYTLSYEMPDPGKGKTRSVNGLVLYDDIEEHSDSGFAGKLSGLDVSYLSSTPLAESDVSIFLSWDGVTSDSSLPGILVDTTGRRDWKKVAAADVAKTCADHEIKSVAVCLPRLDTIHPDDVETIEVGSLSVVLHMVHAGRGPDVIENWDDTLYNGFTVGYVPMSLTDDVVSVDLARQTRIVADYPPMGDEMPKTGGSGTMAVTLAGVVLLTAAGIVAVGASRGKKKDPEQD